MIYHFFWYSNLVRLGTIIFNPPWHDDLEILIKKIKNWPLSTRVMWAQILYMLPESIKLGYYSVLATYFIWTSLLTLSIFWTSLILYEHHKILNLYFSTLTSHSHFSLSLTRTHFHSPLLHTQTLTPSAAENPHSHRRH